MTLAPLRSAYRLILRLHPDPFLERFGGEMLWIFDEECQRGRAVRLLLDGIMSLLRQRCKIHRVPQQASVVSGVIIPDSGIGAARFLQAGLLTSMLVASLLLLARHNPFSSPLRWPASVLRCTITLQPSPHIQTFPDTLGFLQ